MTEPNPSSMDVLLARAVNSLPVPDASSFAGRVVDRLRSQQTAIPPARLTPPRPRWQRMGAIAAGLATAFALTATVVAPVRSAVAGLLGVDGVHIIRANPIPRQPAAPATTISGDPVVALHLGEPTTLQGAAKLVGFPMRLPTIGAYRHPDAVYVGKPPPGGMASMVYLANADRPASPGKGVAALLSEFRGHIEGGFFQKLAGNGTVVEQVQVAGAEGYWLSGTPHEFFYVRPDGIVDSETIRLATNTLLWSAGGITYRLESALSRDAAVAIATSMR